MEFTELTSIQSVWFIELFIRREFYWQIFSAYDTRIEALRKKTVS